ncbi:L-lactate MFS transporter [Basilea psittacipulmonis]|uniref:MFS transporter n=1 Tax=Basilea psittacipulmonis DSM 24701 TaxID=1072685 RepID=A0A077DG33_9BURK|nr:OFA family MFS transporter [Basilea psittacipulmonis]AIL32417.1 MFS transporter [Basilea psittacipulmonis DSM 24701]
MSFFNRSSYTAGTGFNRWLVPPAALAVHMSIGQIYAYSVFNKPLVQASDQAWSLADVGWIFSIALAVLGASAAIFGKWLEKVGPRLGMVIAAICFGLGFFVSALGVYWQNIYIVYLGNGVIGGIGLGLGYIAPVSTLMKWFPDKPGMATGLAIMGFGGGAMLASPLSVALLNYFKTPTDVGIIPTYMVLGVIYFVLMIFGALIVRVPEKNWLPAGYTEKKKSHITHAVPVNEAIKTPQFYLLFWVLCLNVTAGIGVLGQASVMIQEMFSTESVGDRLAVSAAAAAGFVGLLSLFNMGGRFLWSSVSDHIGRKNTYTIFFVLGAILYCLVPTLGAEGHLGLFIICFCIILSMYGGGFATMPAYLRDLYGSFEVGAIHGRVLLAWSTAAVLGPVLVNYIREYQISQGVPKAEAYSVTMYIMAALLLIGLACNLCIKKVNEKHYIDAEIHDNRTETISASLVQRHSSKWVALLSWLLVGVPMLYGVIEVFNKVLSLFAR